MKAGIELLEREHAELMQRVNRYVEWQDHITASCFQAKADSIFQCLVVLKQTYGSKQ